MLENDAKNSYGAFSSSGKASIQLYNGLRERKKILDKKRLNTNNQEKIINFLRRNGYHNIHGEKKEYQHYSNDDFDESQIQEIEQEIDIFRSEINQIQKKKSKSSKIPGKKSKKAIFYHRNDPEAYKFHDRNRSKGIKVKEYHTPNAQNICQVKNWYGGG